MDAETLRFILPAAGAAGERLFSQLAWTAGAFSALFPLAAILAGAVLFRRLGRVPLGAVPPVTLVKPLKGHDRGLYENLASFCRQDYPRFQLLFTLASPDDPALAVVERLRRDFPAVDMEVIVSSNRIGYNPKINNASNAAPFVKHGLLLFTDSDIRVGPDFLRRMAAPLADPQVGLVTAFYQSSDPRGLWARLEALSVNAHFLPQAALAGAFGMRFAMGAAILVRRQAFDAAGGFPLMAGHLADDFVLGEGVREAGWRLEFAPVVVESLPGRLDGAGHFQHMVRWARTIRLCNPSGYAGTLLLHGVSLLTLKALLFGSDPLTAGLLLAALAAKALAKTLFSELWLGGRQSRLSVLFLPLSEWISFAAWLLGLGGGKVLWRGELYAVEARGKLTPIQRRLESPAPAPVP